jgi:hypothetical protein
MRGESISIILTMLWEDTLTKLVHMLLDSPHWTLRQEREALGATQIERLVGHLPDIWQIRE